jgi:hypothetical protein
VRHAVQALSLSPEPGVGMFPHDLHDGMSSSCGWVGWVSDMWLLRGAVGSGMEGVSEGCYREARSKLMGCGGRVSTKGRQPRHGGELCKGRGGRFVSGLSPCFEDSGRGLTRSVG